MRKKSPGSPAPSVLTAARPSKRFILLSFAAILLLGAAVYSNSFDCAFHLDDDFENPVFHDPGNLTALWNYSPRRFVGNYTLALNYHFGHLKVAGYHAVNLAIHLVNALLVWTLALLILSAPAVRGETYARHKYLIASGCGLIFVAHPMQTEAVTYIIQRHASLATFFYLATVICYINGRMSRARFGKTWFLLSLAAAAAGMLTKEITLTLPLMILLLEFSLFQTENLRNTLLSRKMLVWEIPAAVVTIAAPLLLAYDQQSLFGPVASSRFGDPPLTSGVYLMTQFRVVATYIRFLFLPVNQNLDYDFPASQTMFEPGAALSFLFLAGLLAFAVWLFRRNRIAALGIFWFFLTLAIESSIKPIEDVIFEHRLYLPMFGFALALTGAIAAIRSSKIRKSAGVVLLLFIAMSAVLTFRRNEVWKTEVSLWSDAARKSPLKARPHFSLGACHLRAGDAAKAADEYRKTLEIEPRLIDALLGLGIVLQGEGKYAEAASLYERAIQAAPNTAEPYLRLGELHRLAGNYAGARHLFWEAARLDPSNAEAQRGLGRVLSDQGDTENAKTCFRKILARNPLDIESWYTLGLVFIGEKNIAEANRCFLRVVQLNPDDGDAIVNLGNTYLELGDTVRAIACYNEALRINPGNETAGSNLDAARRQQGNR